MLGRTCERANVQKYVVEHTARLEKYKALCLHMAAKGFLLATSRKKL